MASIRLGKTLIGSIFSIILVACIVISNVDVRSHVSKHIPHTIGSKLTTHSPNGLKRNETNSLFHKGTFLKVQPNLTISSVPKVATSSTGNILKNTNTKTGSVPAATTKQNSVNTQKNVSDQTDRKSNAISVAQKDYDVTQSTLRKAYLTVNRAGRLGNQLFQYAALFGFTKHSKVWSAYLVKGKFYMIREIFQITIPEKDNVNITTRPVVWSRNPAETVKSVHDRESQNTMMRGSFQSHKYFTHVEEDLRKELTFQPELHDKVRDFFSEITPVQWKNSSFVRIGIHVRRTDQITPTRLKAFGNVIHPASYFRHAMSYFLKPHARVQFIVASDDIQWCKEHLAGRNVVFSQNNYKMDFAIISLCDHAITSLGTYSWWMGWLCRGTTVYYGVLPATHSEMGIIYSNNSYIPPDSKFNNWMAIR